jgi:hypothetical protein
MVKVAGAAVDIVAGVVAAHFPALDDTDDIVGMKVIVVILQAIANPVVGLADGFAQILYLVGVVPDSLKGCDIGHRFQLRSAMVRGAYV